MANFHNRNMGGVSDDDAWHYAAERRLNWADGLLNYGDPTEVDLVHGFGSHQEIRDYHATMRGSFDTLAQRQAAAQDSLLQSGIRPWDGTIQDMVSWQAEYLQERGTDREWDEFKRTVLELKASGVHFDDNWAETDNGNDHARALAQDPHGPVPFGYARDRFLTPIQQRALNRIDRLVGRSWSPVDVARPDLYDAMRARSSGDRIRHDVNSTRQALAERRSLRSGDYVRVGVYARGNLMTAADTTVLVSNALNLSMYTEAGREGIWLPEFHRRIMPVIGVGVDGQVKPGRHPAPVAREFSAEEVITAAIDETVEAMRTKTEATVKSLEHQLRAQGLGNADIADTISRYLRGSEFQRQFRLDSKSHFRGLIEHFDGGERGTRVYSARDASRLIFGLVNDRLSLNAGNIPQIDPFTLAHSTQEQRVALERTMQPDQMTGMKAFGLDKLQRIGGGLTDFNFTFMAQGLYRQRAAGGAKAARFFLNEHLARFGVTANLDENTNVYFIPASKWAQIPQRTQTLAAMMELDFHAGEGATLKGARKLFSTQAGDERMGVDLKGFVVFGLGDTGFMNEHAFGRAGMPKNRLASRKSPNILVMEHGYVEGYAHPVEVAAVLMTPDMEVIDTFQGDLYDNHADTYNRLADFAGRRGGKVVLAGSNVRHELETLKRAESAHDFHLARSATVYDPTAMFREDTHQPTIEALRQKLGITEDRLMTSFDRVQADAAVLGHYKRTDPALFPTAQGGTPTKNFRGSMVSVRDSRDISVPTHQLAEFVENSLLIRPGDIFGAENDRIGVASTVDGLKSAERAIMNPASKFGSGSFTVVEGIGYENLGYYTRINVSYEVYRPFTSMDRIMDVLKVPVVVAKRALFDRMGKTIQKFAQDPEHRIMLNALGMDLDNLGDTANIMVGEGVIKTGEIAMQTGASLLMDRAAMGHVLKTSDATLSDIIRGMVAKDNVTGRELFANLRKAPLSEVRRSIHRAAQLLQAGTTLDVSNMDHVAASYIAFEVMQRSFREATSKGAGALSRVFGYDRDGGTPAAYVVPVRVVSGFSSTATQLGTRNVGFMTYYNSGDGTDTLLGMLSESDQSKAQRGIVGELYANVLFGGLSGRTMFGGLHFDPLVHLNLGENTENLSRLGRVTEALRTGVYTKEVVDRATGQVRTVAREMTMTPLRIERLKRMGRALIERSGETALERRSGMTPMKAAESMEILKAQKAFGAGATSMTFPILNRDSKTGQVEILEMSRVDFLSPEATLGLAAHVDHVGPIAQLQIDIQKQMAVLAHMRPDMDPAEWDRYEHLRNTIDEYTTEKQKLIGSNLQKAFGRVATAGRSAILGAVPGIQEGTLVMGAELYRIVTDEARKGVLKVADDIKQSRAGMRKVEAILTAFGEDPLTAKPTKEYGKIAQLAKLKDRHGRALEQVQARTIGGKGGARGAAYGTLTDDELRERASGKGKKDPAAKRELARRLAVNKAQAADARFGLELVGLEKRFRSKGLLASGEAMPTDLKQIGQLRRAEELLRMTGAESQDFLRAALQRSGAPIGHLALSVNKVMSIAQHNRNARRSGGVEISTSYSMRAVFSNLAGMGVFLGDFDGDTASVGALEQWAMGTAWERAAGLGFAPTGTGKKLIDNVRALRDSVLGDPDRQHIEFARHYTGYGEDIIKTRADAIHYVKQSEDVFGKMRVDAIRFIEEGSTKGVSNMARLNSARTEQEREKVLREVLDEHVNSKQFEDSVEKMKASDKIGEPIKKALLQNPLLTRSVATAIAWSATAVIGQTFEATYKGSILLRGNRHMLADRFTKDELKAIDGIYHSMNQLVRDAIKPKDIEEITGKFAKELIANPTEMIRNNVLVKGAESLLILTTGKNFYHQDAEDMHGPKARAKTDGERFQEHMGNVREALLHFHGAYEKKGDKIVLNAKKASKITQNVEAMGRFLSESQEYFRWMSKYKHAAKDLSTHEFEALSAEMDGASGNKLNPNHVRLMALWSNTSRGKLGMDPDGDQSMGRILGDILQRTPDASRLRAEADLVDTTGHLGKTLYEVANRVTAGRSNAPINDPRALQASQELYREFIGKREGISHEVLTSSGNVRPRGTMAAEIAAGRSGAGHHLMSNIAIPMIAMAGLGAEPASAHDLGAMGASIALSTSMPGVILGAFNGIRDPRQFAAHAAAMAGTMAGAMAAGHLVTNAATNLAVRFAKPAMAGRIGGLVGALAATVVGWGIDSVINHDRPANDRIGFSRVAQTFNEQVGSVQDATAENIRQSGGVDEVEELVGAPSTQIVTEDGVLLPWGDDQPADNGSYTNVLDEAGDSLTHYSRDDFQTSEGMDFGNVLERGSIRGGKIETLPTGTNHFGLFQLD